MKKDTTKPPVVPAILSLETLSDFAKHATEIDANRVYLTVTNQDVPGKLVASGQGSFTIVATARTETTVVQYQEKVADLTHIDAEVRPEQTADKIKARLARISRELNAGGFTAMKGRWTL